MMNRRSPQILLVALALFTTECGYFMAGTWDDDPGNWKRAFHYTKPADVTVVHSRYWRSAHWTYEYQYFFEIAPTESLRNLLFTRNRLRQVTGDDAAKVRRNVFGEPPSWFAPNAVTTYEVCVFEEGQGSNFMVLIDKHSGNMFMTDYQV